MKTEAAAVDVYLTQARLRQTNSRPSLDFAGRFHAFRLDLAGRLHTPKFDFGGRFHAYRLDLAGRFHAYKLDLAGRLHASRLDLTRRVLGSRRGALTGFTAVSTFSSGKEL